MTPTDVLSLVLALAGVAGALARAGLTVSQPFLSRKTIGDALVGGFVGVLWPLYPVIDFPASATLLQKAVIVMVIAYFAGDVLQNGLSRLLGAIRPANGNSANSRLQPPTP